MISIAQRLRPFSHLPGTRCLIPSTGYIVQAFPALVRILDLKGSIIKEVNLEIKGPLEQFTLMQDLERGCVTIFSEVYKFHILPDLQVVFKKNPGLGSLKTEVLALGSHKKQEWASIKKRCDFNEIFPLWMRLGSLINLPLREEENVGIFELIGSCKEAIASHRPEMIFSAFKNLFLAGIGDMMVPRLSDQEHQGIFHSNAIPQSSPLYLLTEGAALIRSLFVSASGNAIAILPNLPPECFAGRMVHVEIRNFGQLDMEWSKKMIRCIEFRCSREGELDFHFKSDLKKFRLRSNKGQKGKIIECGTPIQVKSGEIYLLDQFQK